MIYLYYFISFCFVYIYIYVNVLNVFRINHSFWNIFNVIYYNNLHQVFHVIWLVANRVVSQELFQRLDAWLVKADETLTMRGNPLVGGARGCGRLSLGLILWVQGIFGVWFPICCEFKKPWGNGLNFSSVLWESLLWCCVAIAWGTSC